MEVLKFGGSLLDGPSGARQAARLIETTPGRKVVVVSAFRDVTNRLERIASLALTDSSAALDQAKVLAEEHDRTASDVLEGPDLQKYRQRVSPYLARLSEIIEGLSIVGELSPRTLDLIVSFGERWSSAIMTAVTGGEYVSATDLILTDSVHRYARPDVSRTRERISRKLVPLLDGGTEIVVTEGYIALSDAGEVTTMGRESSDYSATLIAEFSGAERVTLITGVPGVMTADPELIDAASVIGRLSWSQARLIAELGAKILHPRTVTPAERAGIPLIVRSIESSGSEICGVEDVPIRAAVTHLDATLLRVRTARPSDSVDGFLHELSGRSPILWYSRFRRDVTVCTATSIAAERLPLQELPGSELLEHAECGMLSAVGGSASLRLAMLALASDGLRVLGTTRGGETEPLVLALPRSEIREALALLHQHHVLQE